jgi:hypothetical protein
LEAGQFKIKVSTLSGEGRIPYILTQPKVKEGPTPSSVKPLYKGIESH